MNEIVTALPVILDLIAKLAPGFAHLINWVMAIRPILQQSEAWTPELQEAFLQALLKTKTDPAYQQDQKV
jgi:hypothetical protein